MRQKIRYEHFEEKRQLKIKAVENVLLKCQAKDQTVEGMQVNALLDEVKRSKSNINGRVQTLPSTNVRNNMMKSGLKNNASNRATFFGSP